MPGLETPSVAQMLREVEIRMIEIEYIDYRGLMDEDERKEYQALKEFEAQIKQQEIKQNEKRFTTVRATA